MSKLGLYITLMNYKVDKTVDQFINDVLDKKPEIVLTDDYYAYFRISNEKQLLIWIANKWYGYASDGLVTDNKQISILGSYLWKRKRASRKTIWRLHKYIKENEPELNPYENLEKLRRGL